MILSGTVIHTTVAVNIAKNAIALAATAAHRNAPSHDLLAYARPSLRVRHDLLEIAAADKNRQPSGVFWKAGIGRRQPARVEDTAAIRVDHPDVRTIEAQSHRRIFSGFHCFRGRLSERLQFGLGAVRQRITVDIQHHGHEAVIAHDTGQVDRSALAELIHDGLEGGVAHLFRVQ